MWRRRSVEVEAASIVTSFVCEQDRVRFEKAKLSSRMEVKSGSMKERAEGRRERLICMDAVVFNADWFHDRTHRAFRQSCIHHIR